MKSVAFFNNKGGVGKTTLICNLAAYLAHDKKKRILIIDIDPQCNASAYVLPEAQLEEILLTNKHTSIDSFFDPIRKGKGYAEGIPTIFKSDRFGIDLIVGDPKLSLREDLLSTDWSATVNGEPRGFQTTFSIRELISRMNDYDFVFVDMGPSLGAINRAILLAVDYFIMPLSVDIFSLMAISNIIKSFENWKSDLADAISNHAKKENDNFKIAGSDVTWSLRYAGYVTQQYKSKSVKGVREPVQAFDLIITAQRQEMIKLCTIFNKDVESADLGDVPILSSIIPMSQSAHAPVFMLDSRDGIVGSGYARVAESKEIFENIGNNFLKSVAE